MHARHGHAACAEQSYPQALEAEGLFSRGVELPYIQVEYSRDAPGCGDHYQVTSYMTDSRSSV